MLQYKLRKNFFEAKQGKIFKKLNLSTELI